MAKPQAQKPQSPAPPKAPEAPQATTIYSYRIERLTTFEFQSYRVARQPDGSFKEEIWNKSSLFELVQRRVVQAMREEANKVFEDNKKAKEKAMKAARDAAASL